LAPSVERNPNFFQGKSRRRLLEKITLGRGGNSFSPTPFSFPPRPRFTEAKFHASEAGTK